MHFKKIFDSFSQTNAVKTKCSAALFYGVEVIVYFHQCDHSVDSPLSEMKKKSPTKALLQSKAEKSHLVTIKPSITWPHHSFCNSPSHSAAQR